MLALQHLQAYADCVLYRGNDDLLRGAAETFAAAGDHLPRAVGGGGGGGVKGGGNGGGRWLPVGPASRPGGTGKKSAAAGRRGLLVSTADMNASLAVDMASYFFPASLPLDRSVQQAVPDTSGGHHGHHDRRHGHGHGHGHRHGHRQQQRKQETAPRPFDGGSLMAAACPLPGAKIVDIRSSLSVGSTAAAAACPAAAGPPAAATAANKDWAALATDLGRRAPLCPRKGGGFDDDACVAAHHVVRGVTPGARAGGGESRGAVGAGAAESSGGVSYSGGRRHGGGAGGGVDSSSAAAAVALGEGPGVASEALRRHHECPAWRTATDASCGPGMKGIIDAENGTLIKNWMTTGGGIRQQQLNDVATKHSQPLRFAS